MLTLWPDGWTIQLLVGKKITQKLALFPQSGGNIKFKKNLR